MIHALSLSLATAAAPAGEPNFLWAILPWILIFVIFYMLMIRPQQKKMKEHQSQIAAIKKGDEVITGGGIRGRVIKATDDELEVEIANGVRVRVVRGTVSQVVAPKAKPAND